MKQSARVSLAIAVALLLAVLVVFFVVHPDRKSDVASDVTKVVTKPLPTTTQPPLVAKPEAAPKSSATASRQIKFTRDKRAPLPPIDLRPVAESVKPLPAREAARTRLAQEIPGVQVEFDPVSGAPSYVQATGRFLTPPSPVGQPARQSVEQFIEGHRELFGHDASALNKARVTREDVTKHTGMSTLVWNQEVNGIPVFKTILKANVTKTGEVVSLSDHFVAEPQANRTVPAFDAPHAIMLAAKSLDDEVIESAVASTTAAEGAEQFQRFTAPGQSDTTAQLTYLPMDEQNVRLGWDVTTLSLAQNTMFRMVVDAESGEVLYRTSLTNDATDASFRVYADPANKKPFDSPAPMLPGTSTPSGAQASVVSRNLVTLQSTDATASPNGWINDGGQETLGNNVDAHGDLNADNVADLPRPNGGVSRVFDLAMDLSLAPGTYKDASVVQLFYLNNWMHDRLYGLGFTETSGNFQTNNFGRGGSGSDAVQADAQDGSGTNNANMNTPADGSPPRMQMYVFTGPTPDRDGDFDAVIVLHEYTHGLSNRLVGGGVGISQLQTGGMGEGWSDFYGLALLADPNSDPNAVYPGGSYATLEMTAGMDTNYYFGIRRYPYCTDMAKNPLTFKDIDPILASPHAGVPLSPLFGSSNGNPGEVHNVGEVWCMMLWEVRANLMAKYGGVSGNERTVQLVTDAMKLSPANPTLVQSRDAILQADLVSTGGTDAPEIWAAFAKRGMGVGAIAPANSTTTGVTESYDLQDPLGVTLANFNPVGTRVTGPVSPAAQAYTLTNSGATTLNWTAAKTQSWLNLSSTGGSLAPGASVVVTASIGGAVINFAVGTYSDTITFTDVTSGLVRQRPVNLTINPLLSRLALFSLDADPQWTRQGQWAYGTPTGGGLATFNDPTAGATGTKVFGINLAGNYSTDVGAFEYLTTGPMNLTGVTGGYLKFRRWLNASAPPFVSDTIDVSTDGTTWTNIWTNASLINETSWTTQQYPLGVATDNQPQVYVRWGHRVGSTGTTARGGWNLDDIELMTGTQYPNLSATAQTLSTFVNTPVSATLSGADTDAPGATLTITQVSSPANGVISGTLPNITYTPNTGFTGTDSINFTVTNGPKTSAPAAITFLVLPPPPVPPDIAVEQPEGVDLTDGSSTISFGSTVAGTSVMKRFKVRNVSGSTLTLSGITIDGANASEFTATAPTASLLAVGASAYFMVTFSPTLVNTRSATLHLANDDPDEGPFDIALTGTGTTYSAGITLTKDINQTFAGLTAGPIATLGSNGYFSGTTVDNGIELWKTDGTTAGTILLKDIASGTASSSPASLVVFGGALYFSATNITNGIELWKSDGTTAGTTLLKDIATGVGNSSPSNLTVVGSTLFFSANDTTNGTELWKSDGTAAGTVLVKDINAGTPNSSPANLTNVNGTLFFTATDTTNGAELWKSDGTAAGTVLVKDVNPGTTSGSITQMTAVGSLVFFSANDGTNGTELWVSDGTTAGTFMVKDITPGSTGSTPLSLVNFNGMLYFAASDGVNGGELWKSDGTGAGTQMVLDLYPGANSGAPIAGIFVINGAMYFGGLDAAAGRELFKSDGTAAGTVMVKDIATGAGSSTPGAFTLVGSTIFFTATSDGSTDTELWKTDGTTAGTVLVKDINLGPGGSSPGSLANVGGTLVFSASDGLIGQELWKSDGTTAGTTLLLEAQTGSNSAAIANVRVLNGMAIFTATDGVAGTELWRSAGSPGTTSQLRDIASGTTSSSPSGLVAIGGTIYFSAFDSTNGTELWKTDGSTGGTSLVSNILSGASSSGPSNLTAVGTTLFFSATGTTAQGSELWKSDGSSAGTVLVKDINATANTGSSISNAVAFNGKLFFSANDGVNGAELWSSDGTAAGTTLVLDINAGSASSSPANMRVVGSTLFFTATTAAAGTELWKTDGTAAGTSLVLDINAGTANGSPTNLTAVGSTLFFSATTAAAGIELWKSDGSAAGTALVLDIFSGTSSSSPGSMVASGSTLYFAATNAANGRELWKSDGTAGGTALVADLISGTATSSPNNLTLFNGAIYFSATTTATGNELFKSDGTGAGTVLVADLLPGTTASTPTNLTASGNRLYFSARAADTGTSELFMLEAGTAADLAVEQPAGTPLLDGSSTVDWGSVNVGGAAVTKTFIVKNTGGQSLTLTGFTIDGVDAARFSAAPSLAGTVLAGGALVPLNVSFTPITAGAQAAALHIASNDVDENPFDLTLTGTGVDAPELLVEAPSGVERFDGASAVNVGESALGVPVTLPFVLRNTGTSVLNVTGISFDGANSAEFSAGSVTTVSAGGNATLNVTFTPSTFGQRRATMHILSDDADEASYDVDVTGYGTVAAGPLKLARNINQQGNSTTINAAVMIGTTLYFSASDASTGAELWKSDGTATGTVLVKDINPGTNSSTPANFVVIGTTLYFTATDATTGNELWKSDGTTAGTVQVKDIFAGASSSSPTLLVNAGGVLFFTANDGTNGAELWKSDGTSGGTVLVKDINTAAGTGSTITLLTVAGTSVYFSANDGTNGAELWKSDGTAVGTVLVKDINTTAGTGSSLGGLTMMGSTLFFSANNTTNGGELWKSDGTTAGTVMVMDINPGSGSSNPFGLTVSGSTLFFSATNGGSGTELWKTDGTTLGTMLVRDIHPTGSSGPGNLVADGNGGIYFSATDGTNGVELWKSDGTSAGTQMIANLNPGFANSGPSGLTMINGALYFVAGTATNGNELWKSDGTAAGTAMIRDLGPGVLGTSATRILSAGSTIYFLGNNGTDGTEWWKTNGTATGTSLVKDFTPGDGSAVPGLLRTFGNSVVFTATDGLVGSELWSSDGSTTALVADIAPGSTSSTISAPVVIEYKPDDTSPVVRTLYFSASDGVNGTELWKSDGTTGGTAMVANINPSAGASSTPANLTNVLGKLFFSASDGTNGTELWTSNGSTSGTQMVANIAAGSSSSSPANLTAVGGTLFFTASDAINGTELWSSDGTFAGTAMVKDITPGSTGTSFTASSFATSGGKAFFVANDGSNAASELWVSDGTASGTVMVKDINPVIGIGASISAVVSFNNQVFFNANDGVNGTELWRSDGTVVGTVMVKDINPGLNSSSPVNFVVVGSTLYFQASDGVNGVELWKTDGTTAGTVIVRDIFPGSFASSPANLTNVNGVLYFSASGSTSQGTELWRSDGTTAGTQLVMDLRPAATLASSPANLTVVGTRLFFTATGSDLNTELWSLDTTTTPEIAVYDGNNTSGSERQDNVGAFDFGTVITSTAANFTITNTADTNLYVNDIVIGGASAGSYFVTNKPDPSQPIAKGGTATFTVTALPNGFGAQNAVISVLSNDADEASFDINVTATVPDTTPPVISAPASYYVGQPGAFSMPLPDVRHIVVYTDNINAAGTITQTPAPGSSTLSINQTATVTFTATDAAGNPSNSVTTTLTMGLGQVNDGTLSFATAGTGTGADAGTSSSTTTRVAALPDGGFVVAGQYTSTAFTLGSGANAVTLSNSGGSDVFIARYRSDGSLVWARKGGSTGTDTLTSLIVLSDGSIVAGGACVASITFTGPNTTASSGVSATTDLYLVRYLADGTASWVRCVGGNGTETVTGLAELADGSIAAIGNNSSVTTPPLFGAGMSLANLGAAGTDLWLAKFAKADGVTSWVTAVGGLTGESITGYTVAAAPDGGVVIGGVFFSATLSFTGSATTLTNSGATTTSDFFVAKYSSAGALSWAKAAGGTSNEAGVIVSGGKSIAVQSTGHVVLCGTMASTTATFGSGEAGQQVVTNLGSLAADVIVASLSGSNGTLRWVKRMGAGAGPDTIGAVALLPDDSIAIGGTFSVGIGQFGIGEPAYTTLSPSSTAPEAFVARLRADTGNLFWAKMPVGGSTEAVSQVVALRDGDIGVAGTFLSTALTFGPGEGGQTILTNPGGTATADMFIAKFSRADGALQWAKSGGGTGTETVQAMTMLASNSAVIVGSFQPVTATFGSGETRQTVLTNAESTGTNTDLYIARFNAGGVSPPSAPLVNPLAASGLSSSTITFNVSVDSQGADTTVVVDYGPTTAYGSSATLTLVSAGVAPETRSFTLTGLSPLSTTNFRVTATNAQGSNVTNNVAVTTYTDAEVEVEESAAVLVDGAATVNFAGVGVGTSSMKTFTIRNVSGTGTLLSLSRSVDGGAAANFVASALGVTTLAPGASTTITVTYMPTVPGPRSAALHIVSNDGDESPFDINLTGDNFLATTFNSASDVPITANGYTVPTGRTLTLQLNFAPSAGTLLKVIDNTSGNPISGTFYGLPQNGIIAASFGGQTYYFQASYSGGDGNDLVLGETLEWTWMKGLGVNSTGSAGTQGTPSGTTFPGSRQGASSWTDATGNLWLLGGNGISTTSQSGYLNDLWKYNKATNQWVWLKGSTTTTNVNGVYGTQGVAASTNAPGARQVGTTWVDGAGILWLFGGFGYPATGTTQGYLNDLWKYDPATNNWTWMGGSTAINTNGTYGTQGTAAAGNIPGGRWSSFRWIDGSGNLWLFGGQGYPATGTTVGSLNDLWKYDPVANQWTWMKGGSAIDTFAVHGTKGVEAGTNMPGGRYGTAGWKDAQGRFWLFAGFGVNTSAPGRLADVWRYDPATNNWTWMNGPIPVNANGAYGLPGVADATNQPGGRWDPAAWIDTLGRVWVFGGSGIGATTSTVGDLADLWTYDPATSLWTFIRGSTAINTLGSYVALGTPLPGSAPGGRERISSFHASGAVSDVWMFGGLGFGVTGTTAGNICDLWTLDLPGAPVVSTSAPSPVSAIAATLRATVSTNNFATTVRFKWGTSPTLAGATTTTDQVIASGSGVLVTQAITGLNFSTTYYCQVIADNFAGTASGSILSFATPAASDIVIEQPAGSVLADGAVVDIGSAGIAAAASKTFTLKNLGTAALSINPPTIDGTHASDFVVGSLPSSLAVSGSTTFTVTFTPSTTGARSATLHIASNDPDESPFDINLTGTGLTAYQAAQQAAGITGTADPDGDEDSDGIRNAMEVAFGTDPGSSGSGTSALVHTGGFAGGGAISSRGQPIVEQEPAPNTVDLRAVFVRRKDAAALGITYTVQFSADMITWQSSTVIPTVLADDGTYQIVSVPYPFFIGKKKARFFHVVISISP